MVMRLEDMVQSVAVCGKAGLGSSLSRQCTSGDYGPPSKIDDALYDCFTGLEKGRSELSRIRARQVSR